MKRYKRIMSLALSVVMALLATLCFSGCFEEELILSTYGDFIITQHNKIYDLSDEGLQKEYVIVPEKINGDYTRVYWLQYGGLVGGRDYPKSFTQSGNLKKVYFEVDLEILETSSENIRKYREKTQDFAASFGGMKGVKVFYVEAFWGGLGKTPIFNSSRCCIQNGKFISYRLSYLANIQFMYNFEDSPNRGYYWIDDLETGETLSYMPKDPTREGYTFGGWYADSECTTPYDFTIPYLKKDIEKGSTQEEYLYYLENYPTYIYAKWIEN